MKKIIIVSMVMAACLCLTQMSLEGIIPTNNNANFENSPTTLFPDLVGDHSAVSDLTLEPGAPFQLFYSVSNIGDASAGASDTKFYFSNDQTFGDGDDIYVTQATCGALIEGATLSFTGNLSVPASLALGTWYLFFKVDANNSVAESSESNNVELVSWPFTIGGTVPQITLLAPNGGESWQVGNTHNITWISSNITGNVRIDLMQGTGTTPVLTISSSSTLASETYSWTIPAAVTPGNNYKIKLTSLSDTSVNDISNSFFTIVPAPTVTVLFPNGGETLLEEASYSITWSYNGLTGNVKIDLMQGTGTVMSISPSIAVNTGTYDWLIPVSLSQASNYKIRITSLTNPAVDDLSNDYFTINPAPSISVSSPNGGEVWLVDGTYNVNWTSTNLSGNVKIELMQGTSPNPVITINPSILATTGTYSWLIPSALDPAANYKVKISSLNNTAINDYSNSYFTINPAPSLTVLSPNGGENWLQGNSYNISWANNSLTGNVKIELMQGTGTTPVLSISASTPVAAGSYGWTIPPTVTPANNYKIKISSLSTVTVYDQSNAFFTIDPPASITVLAPNGGETWLEESSYAVSWSSVSLTGNVKIELMQGTSSTPILTISPLIAIGTGVYDWLIPASLSQANNYKIKITSLSNPAVNDLSNDYFTINPAPSISVSSPNGGEVWLVEGTYTISWSSTNLSGNVKIELMQGTNPNPVITINPSILATAATYSWQIPTALDPATNYKVKISSLSNTAIFDYSNSYFTINPAPSITVLSPNGGEIWMQAGIYSINWGYTSLAGNVKIELMQGTGTTPILTISAATSLATGSYSWTIPPTVNPANDYKIRITSLSVVTVNDQSDFFFTVNPAASITVLAPNGGETWQEGNNYTISWTYLSYDGNVKLELMQGTNATPVSVLTPSISIAAGSFNWLIPSSINQGSDYKIKISSLEIPSLNDLSNDYFTINRAPSLTVISPNGGNVWLKGTTQQINWTTVNLTGNVIIELLQEANVVSTISNSSPADAGTFSWAIPNDLVAGNNYRIKITSLSLPAVHDMSDAPFTIADKMITVQSPNGLEIWISGESYEISWSVQNVTGNVKIELCQGSENVPVATIHSSISAALGSYMWVIPTLNTASDFKVKISSLNDPTVKDLSDAYFTIEHDTDNVDQVQTPRLNIITGTYPNPFNPIATITYSLAQRTEVVMDIYNLRGQKVRHLFAGSKDEGTHSIVWNGFNDLGQSLPNGVYTVCLKTDSGSSRYKITLSK